MVVAAFDNGLAFLIYIVPYAYYALYPANYGRNY